MFQYNEQGGLESVNSVQSRGIVLQKSIYYDGELRLISRPFFDNLNTVNLDEIIIFDNNVLKYHLRRHGTIPDWNEKAEEYLVNEKLHSVTLNEFDNKGNVIKQTRNLGETTQTIFEVEYTQFDNYGNWVYKKVVNGNEIQKRIREYRRVIVYR